MLKSIETPYNTYINDKTFLVFQITHNFHSQHHNKLQLQLLKNKSPASFKTYLARTAKSYQNLS